MLPYLDLAGFRRRTIMSVNDVDYVEQDSPGFTATRIALATSHVNGRLRKRYGKSLPFGTAPPGVDATFGPVPTLSGRPVLGSLQVTLAIRVGGPAGTATFDLSLDGGATYPTTGLVTSTAPVTLPGTGMTAAWPTGAVLTAGDLQSAPTPVPEVILAWITVIATHDVLRKRGVNPQDPIIQQLREDLLQAHADIKEAADSKDGLFDLPANEDAGSAVTTGGPLGHAEASPYEWMTTQRRHGRREDAQRPHLDEDDDD